MTMTFTPTIAIHTTFALSAVAIGPLALWSRLRPTQRPRWHRAAGYAWVTCLLGAALSALFIRSTLPWSVAGWSPIHLLIPLTLAGLFRSFKLLNQGRIQKHRQIMLFMYGVACLVTGLFTLLPNRLLGQWLWHDMLGVL